MDTVYFTDYPDIKWQVQHIDGDYAYLALTEISELTDFGTNSTYADSTIAGKCTTFLNTVIPNVADCLEYVTASGVTNRVFIPEQRSYNLDWDWTKDNQYSHRICRYNGSNVYYWTSTKYGKTASIWEDTVYPVDVNGTFSITLHNVVNSRFGFRPAVKVRFR